MKRITPRKTKEVFEIKYFLKSYEYPGRSKLSKKKQKRNNNKTRLASNASTLKEMGEKKTNKGANYPNSQ